MKSWRNKYLKIYSKAILNKGQKGEYLKKLLSCTGSSLLISLLKGHVYHLQGEIHTFA